MTQKIFTRSCATSFPAANAARRWRSSVGSNERDVAIPRPPDELNSSGTINHFRRSYSCQFNAKPRRAALAGDHPHIERDCKMVSVAAFACNSRDSAVIAPFSRAIRYAAFPVASCSHITSSGQRQMYCRRQTVAGRPFRIDKTI